MYNDNHKLGMLSKQNLDCEFLPKDKYLYNLLRYDFDCLCYYTELFLVYKIFDALYFFKEVCSKGKEPQENITYLY